MPGKPIVLTAKDVQPLLRDAAAMKGAVDALERAMLAEYQGRVRTAFLADETKLNEQPSTLRVNLLASDGMMTNLRLITSAQGATQNLNSFSSAQLCFLVDEDRQLAAIVDPSPFNAVRVGAEGGLGGKHLAPAGARTMAMLGSGRQARTQMSALCASLPGVETIKVFSPTPEHREAFAAEMAAWTGRNIMAVASVDEALADADVVDLVNTSREPIFSLNQIKPGALIISITGRGQMPAEVLKGTRMIAPVWSILAGNQLRDPFYSAIKEGSYTKEDYGGDLGAIIAGDARARSEAGDIVDFEATAVPILDHAIIEWAYNWARATGAGTEIALA